MGKTSKCVVAGMKGVGKTTILEQLIYGNFESQDLHPTIEDIYAVIIETDRKTKEMIRFYDTEGLSLNSDGSNAAEVALPKHYHSLADAFVLVYSVNSRQSFEIVDLLKKDIDKNREKKEIPVIMIGVVNVKNSNKKREVDPSFAVSWASREKIQHYEVTVLDRKNLAQPFIYLASKLNPPQTKSSFAPLGIVGRSKTKE